MSIRFACVAWATVLLGSAAFAQGEAILRVPGGTGRENLGASVSLSADTLVAGAPGDVSAGLDAGAVYVFQRSGQLWPVQAQLIGADTAEGDAFGFAVEVEGDTLVVGAARADVNAPDSGAAYVFERTGAVWNQVAKLSATDGAQGDRFGFSVAIEGDWVAIGAPRDNGIATDSGSVYLFQRVGNSWNPSAKLVAADAGLRHQLGTAVDLDRDRLIAGAPRATGVADNTGAAYVYLRTGLTWNLEQKVFSSAGASGDRFGRDVALTAMRAAIGAPNDDRGVNGVGKAFVFDRSGTTWMQVEELGEQNPIQNARFGIAVDTDCQHVYVGSPDPTRRGRLTEFALDVPSGALLERQVFRAGPGPLPRHQFGSAVSAKGSYVAIGMPRDDELGTDSGAVHVFLRPAAGATVLAGPLLGPGEEFGAAVGVYGPLAVVGAPFTPNTGGSTGRGHVFEFTPALGWVYQQELLPQFNSQGTRNATSLDIDGEFIALGSTLNSSTGRIVMFQNFSGTWSESAVISSFFDFQFARSVALRGSVLVGSTGTGFRVYRRNASNWGLETAVGSQNTDPAAVVDTDAARIVRSGVSSPTRIYTNSGTSWPFEQAIPGSLTSVSIDGFRIALGQPFQMPEVWIYAFQGTSWTLQDILSEPTVPSFGACVSLDGDQLVVGSPSPPNGMGNGTGTARTYREVAGSWVFESSLAPVSSQPGASFGSSVALRGGFAVVGSPLEDVGSQVSAGVANGFDLSSPPVVTGTYCIGKTNSLGCVPFVTSEGTPSQSDPLPFTVRANDVIPDAPGFLIYGFGSDSLDFHGGRLCVKAPFTTLPPRTATSGGAPPCSGILEFDFNDHIQSCSDPSLLIGQQVYLQWMQRDLNDPTGFMDSLSDAISISVLP